MNHLKSNKIKTLEELKDIINDLKAQGKRIATTNGSFDILHVGHVLSLEIAKKQGDVLIVALNSDKSVKSYKSVDRPIVPQEQRAKMLASLSVVDYVVIFDEDDPRNVLSVIKPDVHVKAKSGYKGIEKDVVEKNNGKIFLFDPVKGFSTTNIINKIISVYCNSKH